MKLFLIGFEEGGELIRNRYYETRDAMAMTFLNSENLEFEEVDKSALVNGAVMVMLRIKKNA